MYQLALPYFPGNEKLKNKMKNLEERIRAKKQADSSTVHPSETSRAQPSHLMAPLRQERNTSTQAARKQDDEDDEFAPVQEADDDDYASDNSFRYKSRVSRKPKKVAKKLPIFRDGADSPDPLAITPQCVEHTPRTSHLLRIINSKDVSKIKALKGVGTKKADMIVNCLVEMEDEEVRDLESLALLKGVGGRTVENMRLGLSVDVSF
jgi:DNA uptake protein ComE-like DNA-binding protein